MGREMKAGAQGLVTGSEGSDWGMEFGERDGG